MKIYQGLEKSIVIKARGNKLSNVKRIMKILMQEKRIPREIFINDIFKSVYFYSTAGLRSCYGGGKWVIGEKCLIGAQLICESKDAEIHVGKSTFIAGSVVTKNIPSWTIAAGNPAKVIKEIPINER